MKLHKQKKISLRATFRDGKWELLSGGEIPVAEGTVVEMSVPESSITDQKYLELMKSTSLIRILDRGTRLRAYLATKNLEGVSDKKRACLFEWPNWPDEIATDSIDSWSSGPINFFELNIGPATEKQFQDFDTSNGGLWLYVQGGRAKGLKSSQFEFPDCVSVENATSLNHAFTILSEVYEPWRLSHTGNVYDRFFYQEADQKWYPLSLLRDFTLAKEEQKIAFNLWRRFMAEMSIA